MKEKILVVIMTALVSAALVGCGSDTGKKPSVSFTDSDKTEYKENITEKSGERVYIADINEESLTLKQEYIGVKDDQSDCFNISSELLQKLNTVEKMNDCSAKHRTDIKIEKDGKMYSKLADHNFSRISDIDDYMNKYFTGSLISERFSGIISGEAPSVIESEGALYLLDAKNGNGFPWVMNDDKPDITVVASEENSFEVSAAYKDDEVISYLNITFVKDSGYWKIDSVETPEYEEEMSW